MGNLITTVGQDSGEGGTNQLLASTRNEPEARSDSCVGDRRRANFAARNCVHPAVRRERTESRQAPSTMSLSQGSRASLVPHRTARERTAERPEIQARGDNLEQCDRRRTNHILSSRRYPRGVPAAPRTGTDLRRTTKVVTEQSSSSSTSSSSSLTPPPEFLAPGSRSDERRMLAQPHFQVSAPKVHRPLAEHVEGPPGLPVDAVVNTAVPLQGSGGKWRRSQIKRCVLCSVLSLVVTTGILAVLTWSILEDPLGGDAQRRWFLRGTLGGPSRRSKEKWGWHCSSDWLLGRCQWQCQRFYRKKTTSSARHRQTSAALLGLKLSVLRSL
ncbi:hypothetical protein MRX96_049697 [Rhipicephalus microplus]